MLCSRAGDQLTVAYQKLTERLVAPFEISPAIAIPVGRYGNENWRVEVSTATHRKITATLHLVDYKESAFFGGDRDDSHVQITWRPSPHFRAQASYDYSDIELPGGSFETRLVRTGVDFIFSSSLSWANFIQYDNVTETAGINMRLHWIPEAGRDIYFVINHNAGTSIETTIFVRPTRT